MKKFLWLLKWILKAAIFFTLFAFALNNQQETTVHFFFGTQWRTSIVIIVLAVFALGVAVGALGMVPRWLRHRRVAIKAKKSIPVVSTPNTPVQEKLTTSVLSVPADYPL